MKMHLINLPRHTERLARMRRIGSELGIEWQVFAAVDGSDQNLDFNKWNPEGTLRPAEIACFLSHRMIWERIADGEEDMAGVFEDDVHFQQDFMNLMRQMPAVNMPTIYRLEAWDTRVIVEAQPVMRIGRRALHRYLGPLAGAAAYVINRSAARVLVEDTRHFSIPVDFVISQSTETSGKQSIERLICLPAPCTQDQHLPGAPTAAFLASSLKHPDRIVAPLHPGKKLLREAIRPLAKIGDFIRLRRQGRKSIRLRFG